MTKITRRISAIAFALTLKVLGRAWRIFCQMKSTHRTACGSQRMLSSSLIAKTNQSGICTSQVYEPLIDLSIRWLKQAVLYVDRVLIFLNLGARGLTRLLRQTTFKAKPITFALTAVLLFFPFSSHPLAQAPQTASPPPEPEAGVDDNPTRAVFFSVREEYRNLINGAWNNRVVLRKDTVVLKGNRLGGRTGYLLRTDVPITTTHLGSDTHTGLGDIYAQALYIPYLSRKFAFVTGTGIVLPTATHKTLGQGKWQVAPLAVPVWFVPRARGYFFVKFQDYISIAGVGDRPDVHALFINPTLNYVPARRWLVQAEVESRTNWKNDSRTDFRVGFGAGKVITRRLFLGIKCDVPIGPTRSGDWTIKVTNIFYRP